MFGSLNQIGACFLGVGPMLHWKARRVRVRASGARTHVLLSWSEHVSLTISLSANLFAVSPMALNATEIKPVI